MKNRKIIFLIFSTTTIYANNIDLINLSNNFLNYISINKSVDRIDEKNSNLIHLKSGGYIIFNDENKNNPIKAFSISKEFDNLPKEYRDFLLIKSENYKYRDITTLSKEWKFLIDYNKNSKRISRNIDTENFLIKTNWNQSYPYNISLPKIDDSYVLVGCVSVAISQIIKYYEYPYKGSGSLSYNWNNTKLSASFNRVYNYSEMPNDLMNAKKYQIDLLSNFLKDIAIANYTEFNTLENGGSGATINLSSALEYFGYSNEITQIDNSNSNFNSILKSEIDNNRPVLISFPGHLTLADGYIDDELGTRVHINMGWGGESNDFYYLSNSETLTTSFFTFDTTAPNISMIYNIKPCSQDRGDCYINLENNDRLESSNITGMFNYENDKDSFKVNLAGNSLISGDRGYSNQAFFISIFDSCGNLIISSNEKIEYNFEPDEYKINTSLCDYKYETCYSYNSDFNSYSVNITTENSEIIKSECDKNLDIEIFSDDLVVNDSEKIFVKINTLNEIDPINITTNSNNSIESSYKDSILTINKTYNNETSTLLLTATQGEAVTSDSINTLTLDRELKFGKNILISDYFENQNDLNSYNIVLDGECTISGSNGYINQAFFTNINNYTQPTNSSFNDNFYLGEYTLNASFYENYDTKYGTYYTYSNENKNYFIDISCPNATNSIYDIAKTLGISSEENSEKLLDVKTGWNLIFLNHNIKYENSEKIYSYKNNEWIEYKDIINSDIENIYSSYWLKSKIDSSLEVNIENYSINELIEYIALLDSGWHLLSINQDINNLEIFNNEIKYLWIFKNSIWSLYIPNRDNPIDINSIDTINKYDGFWIKK